MSEDSNANSTLKLLDRWKRVFDKSLVTPIPDTLPRKNSSSLQLEEVEEVVQDEVASGGRTFKETPSTLTPPLPVSVPRRVRRQQDNEQVPQPVRLVENPGRRDQTRSAVSRQPSRPISREKSWAQTSPQPNKFKPEKSTVTAGPLKDNKQTAVSVVQQGYQPKAANIPGGQPITLDTARGLRVLLFGSSYTSFNSDFRRQHVNFFRNLSYGLSFYKSGPDGIMACLQAFLLKFLLYEQDNSFNNDYIKSMLQPMSSDRQMALVSAISKMVWQAGGHHEGVVVLPCGECKWTSFGDYREDHLTETLHIFKFKKLNELELFIKKYLSFFENTSGNGCILILYSVILSRSIASVKNDLSEPDATLMGPHDSCTQGMINLLLTGRAVSHVFNGNIEFDRRGRPLSYPHKGVESRNEVGFLTTQEHDYPNTITVGSMLKTPKYPVWVVNTSDRYGVLFCLNKDLLNDWKHERRMELYYYNGSTSHNSTLDHVLLTVDTRYECEPCADPEGPPPIENCIRTKWPGAVIEWNDRKET